ncbi:MAG: class I SAM-dependent methyltransferase [candidate division Zixibacteria bacterium]|nr:class I SAM-dependent methyltransferase [candidate division Zixibacteria bacterium]
MSIYKKFAAVYDQMGEDNFSVQMFNYTNRILKRLRYRPKSVLDIACGTGTAAVLWAQKNTITHAIDGSADMLKMAKTKEVENGVRIEFSKQSLTKFEVNRKFDLVTCYFDSLNYLPSLDEITQTFSCVKKALYPGGYFIFDVNTPEAMKYLWGGEVFADETKDLAWIWKNLYFPKAKTAEVHATFFVRQGEIWERFEEVHSERGYTVTEMKRALKASGFKIVNVYDCLRFVKPDRKSMRIAVVATPK